MKIVVFALIMIVSLGMLIGFRRTSAKNLLPSNVHTGVPHPYHCVAIRYPDGACIAVQRLSGQRFLSKEAPPIPLPECDAANCRCRYVHFEDRRQNDDRRNPHPVLVHVGGYHGPERRSGERRRLVTEDIEHGDDEGVSAIMVSSPYERQTRPVPRVRSASRRPLL